MHPLAAAYNGPPQLTVTRAFTEWRVDVPMLVLIPDRLTFKRTPGSIEMRRRKRKPIGSCYALFVTHGRLSRVDSLFRLAYR